MLKNMIFLVVRFHPKRSNTKMTFMITESLGNKNDFNEPYYIGLCHFIGLLKYADIHVYIYIQGMIPETLFSILLGHLCPIHVKENNMKLTLEHHVKNCTRNLLMLSWHEFRMQNCLCKTYCIYKNGINCLIDGEIHVDKISTLHTSLKAA